MKIKMKLAPNFQVILDQKLNKKVAAYVVLQLMKEIV